MCADVHNLTRVQEQPNLDPTSKLNKQWHNIRERIDKLSSKTEDLAYQPQQMQDHNVRRAWSDSPASFGDGVSAAEDQNVADVNGRTMKAVQVRIKSREVEPEPHTRRQGFKVFVNRVKGSERDTRRGEQTKTDRNGVP